MGNLTRYCTTIISLLFSLLGVAQLPNSPGQNVAFTYGGRQWMFFKAEGWNGTDSNSVFHAQFHGNSQTSATSTEGVPMGLWVKDAGNNWNGLVYMNDGTIKKKSILSIPNYGDAAVAEYAAVIAYVIQQLSMDTTDHRRFIATGISGGGGRMEDYITMTGHSSPYANLFERLGFVSSVSTRNFGTWKPNRTHVWVAGSEYDNITSFQSNINTYNSFKANKRLQILSVNVNQGPHSINSWNTIYNISTLSTPTGSTARTNMLRFLLSDGKDGVTAIGVPGVRRIQ